MEIEIITNVVETLSALWDPVKIVGTLIGYLLVGIGLFCFAMSMDKTRGVSSYAAIMMMVAGFFLVSLDAFLGAASQSLFGESSDLEGLSYSGGGSSAGGQFVGLAIAVAQFLGLIAGIKGIYTLYSQASDRNQSVFTAVMFLTIAVIGLNFPQFLEMLGATLGGVVEESINAVLESAGS